MDNVERLLQSAKPGTMVTDAHLDALREIESSNNPKAVNKDSGAMGAYQFMPSTVTQLAKQGIKFDPFNEPEAREAARQHLQDFVDKSGGDLNKGLALYGGHVTKDPTNYINKFNAALARQAKAQEGSAQANQSGEPEDNVIRLLQSAKTVTPEQPKPAPPKLSELSPFGSLGVPEGDLVRKAMKKYLAPKPAETAPAATPVPATATAPTATPDQIPGSIKQTRIQDPSLLERVIAGPETAARMIYGAGTALIAAPVGVGKEILTGTPKEKTAQQIMELGSDVPMSPGARANLESLGNLTANLPAFVPAIGQAGQISQGLKYATGRSALTAEQALRDQFAAKAPAPRVEPGIGAPAPAAPAPGQPKPRVVYSDVQRQLAEQKAAKEAALTRVAEAPTQRELQAAKEQAFQDLANAPSLQEAQARAAGATPGSVGAAAVDTPRQRVERAANLPIPITLNRAQATKNASDVAYLAKAAKTPHLRDEVFERNAEQNLQIQQNMQAGIEATGTQSQGISPTDFGQRVKAYVQGIKDARKADINAKYAEAEAAGELVEPVSYQPVLDLIYKETRGRPTVSSLNPLYKIIEEEFAVNDPTGSKAIGARQLEDVRQFINDQTDFNDPKQKRLAGKVKRLIDKITENAGGDVFKQARKDRAQWSRDFEDQKTVRSINEIKKGSSDPAIADENLFDDIFLKKSGDQVRRVFDLLDKSGPDGQQLVRDIKGRFGEHILENTTKGVQLDTKGRRYVSTLELDKIITNLDKSGKLDDVFGSQWAANYRELNQATKELQTIPKDVVSTSGSGETILGAISGLGIEAAGRAFADEPGLGLLAYGGGKLLNVARENRKISREQTKLKDFLNYKP